MRNFLILSGSRLLGLLSYIDSFICYRAEVKNGNWLSDPEVTIHTEELTSVSVVKLREVFYSSRQEHQFWRS